ncbi:nuclear transport factor 2 family protein [Fulvimonas yonginensis]|uniref:Nuclear transport factor 2 family protein n=1 Tax=Fulvimonas yonginensis TaxID=1495200 RepID=A0ABU8JAW7_9GAMM
MKDIWTLEASFWKDGPDFYEEHLAPDVLMVLPSPVGVLGRAETIDAIRASVRWRNVRFSGKRLVRAGDGVSIISYVGSADRGGPDSSYSAQCSSTYVLSETGWKLVAHQQTPLHDARE